MCDAPKQYTFQGETKCKGIRHPVQGNNTYTQAQFSKWSTDLLSTNPERNERLEHGALVTQITKTVTGERELWIRAHSRLGKIPVVLTLLGLSNSLECTTKPSNSLLWEEKVIFLASWGELVISRRGVPTEMLSPNPGLLIHNWRTGENRKRVVTGINKYNNPIVLDQW